jgi:hypothetical protein
MFAQASVLVEAPVKRVREAVLAPDSSTDGDPEVQDLVGESPSGTELVARISGHLSAPSAHLSGPAAGWVATRRTWPCSGDGCATSTRSSGWCPGTAGRC